MSTVKVLLCRDTSKKIVTVLDGEDVHEVAAKVFDLPETDFILQYYDRDFEEWVDVEEGYVPINKEKINIVMARKEVSTTVSLSMQQFSITVPRRVGLKPNTPCTYLCIYRSSTSPSLLSSITLCCDNFNNSNLFWIYFTDQSHSCF